MPASLPEKIEEDILSRLPVKTVMQYKCVCKPWYSLFHSPYFIKMQRDRGIDNTFLMLHYWYDSNDSAALYSTEYNSLSSKLSSSTCSTPPLAEAVKMDYPLVPPNYFLLSGSYDGFLCLQTGMIPGSAAEAIFLWNPSTMEHKKLPDSPNKLMYSDRDVSLCGLGYDNKIDDFKLVKVRFVDYYPSYDYSSSDSDDYSSGGWESSSGSTYNYEVYEAETSSHFSLENAEMEVSYGSSEAEVSSACSWPWKPPFAGISEFEVYTLGTNSWKTCKTMPYYFPNGPKSGVVVNGDLHWWAVKIQDGYEAIISFDMPNEEFKEVAVLEGPLLHPGNCDKRRHDNVLGAFVCIRSIQISHFRP